jgi:hypothetical protein
MLHDLMVRVNIISFKPKHNTDFPDPIFMKPTNSQQHYVQICCAEFHQNRTVNADSADRNARSKSVLRYNDFHET